MDDNGVSFHGLFLHDWRAAGEMSHTPSIRITLMKRPSARGQAQPLLAVGADFLGISRREMEYLNNWLPLGSRNKSK
jgi:hypothetical protein